MKTIAIAACLLVIAAPLLQAQPGASARDGFTLRGAEVVITRNGVTTKVERDFALPSGLRVRADGTITRRDGSTTTLRPNQLLTFNGDIQDVALTPEGIAPLSSVDPAPAPKANAGMPASGGITVSGNEAFLTRNGLTKKITSDVRLPNGVVAQPNGTVILNNGNKISLRADQFLDLTGALHDLPR